MKDLLADVTPAIVAVSLVSRARRVALSSLGRLTSLALVCRIRWWDLVLVRRLLLILHGEPQCLHAIVKWSRGSSFLLSVVSLLICLLSSHSPYSSLTGLIRFFKPPLAQLIWFNYSLPISFVSLSPHWLSSFSSSLNRGGLSLRESRFRFNVTYTYIESIV